MVQVVPPSVVARRRLAPPDVAPTAKQSVVVGQEILPSPAVPAGSVCVDQCRPPSAVVTTAAPELVSIEAQQSVAVGHEMSYSCSAWSRSVPGVHVVPPSVVEKT